jgi:leucyl aminopeptidase
VIFVDVYAVNCLLAQSRCDAAACGAFEAAEKGKPPKLPPAVQRIDALEGGIVSRSLKAGEFTGKPGSTAIYRVKSVPARALVLVGLGKREGFEPDTARLAAAKACCAARELKCASVSFCADSVVAGKVSPKDAGRLLTEGAILGLYKFQSFKTDKDALPSEVKSLQLVTAQAPEQLALGAEKGEIVASAANLARELASDPGNSAPPQRIAKIAQQAAKKFGMKCTVLGQKELEREKMGGLLSVSAGSANPPALVVLEHRKAGARKPIVLVGKGITFDSGGVSLKPGRDMDKMKFDKSGACAVLAAMVAAARLGIKDNVVGIMPLAENMPSGTATRPGDIVAMRSGKTVEIVNTDCEGRMVLADALDYAKEFSPRAVLDIATLTGSVAHALGYEASGVLGNDSGLLSLVEAAGEESGERVWRFPMWKAYDEYNKSEVADIRNAGISGAAGTISGAKFLEAFAPQGVPWAHVDIAGTAYSEGKPWPYLAPGATGVGVRLFAALLQKM